jgi:hypothetical protein
MAYVRRGGRYVEGVGDVIMVVIRLCDFAPIYDANEPIPSVTI